MRQRDGGNDKDSHLDPESHTDSHSDLNSNSESDSAEEEKNETIPECFSCHTSVSRPCWVCVECVDDIFICESCETGRAENGHYELSSRASRQYAHQWYHVLIQVKEIEHQPLSKELGRRLMILEQRAVEQESAMRQKLESIESTVAKLGEKLEMLGDLEGGLKRLLEKLG
ncbi:hypothetical protein B0H16DRAFT_205349 [Mycena metata]|uniref:ZZ-type domain-containing protein n=1 Tax=Mycena metata TaxID=1033252 RepID=A0AAD7MTC9_9AGAR|nr:hypothetical protein B0H16DRAFT_205349 [Mycena metata]